VEPLWHFVEDKDASSTRRSPRNLTLLDSSTPELREPIHPILEKLEPL